MTRTERVALWLRQRLLKYEVVVEVCDPKHHAFGKVGTVTMHSGNTMYVKLEDAEYVWCLGGFAAEAFFDYQVRRVEVG